MDDRKHEAQLLWRSTLVGLPDHSLVVTIQFSLVNKNGHKGVEAVSFMPGNLSDHQLSCEQLLNLFVVVVDLDF